MGRAYSDDLRGRAAALVAAGRSCREVAASFGVNVASAVRWSRRLRRTGSAGARPPGRKQPRSVTAERDRRLARLAAEPD